MENIKEKIEEIVEKIKNDKSLMSKFKSDPIKTIEGLIGVDLPDEAVSKIIDGVKAKLSLDKTEGILGKVKGLLKK